MLSRPDYLIPLAAGQRQYRLDSYNMASAAQLEDLFFDAFGRYIRENHPEEKVGRRLGKELWDYSFQGLQISHKEALKKYVSVWWTAGHKGSDGKYEPLPQYQVYSSQHPIVLVYSGNRSMDWVHGPLGDGSPQRGRILGPAGNMIIASPGLDRSAYNLLLGESADGSDDHIKVTQSWVHGEWDDLSFHDVWPMLGGPNLLQRDLYLDRPYADKRRGFESVTTVGDSLVSAYLLETDTGGQPRPGVYVITSEQISDTPLVANNRAHSIAPLTLDPILRQAYHRGNFVPFPLWFALFADAPPPNLYAQQRSQFEDLFVARRRNGS